MTFFSLPGSERMKRIWEGAIRATRGTSSTTKQVEVVRLGEVYEGWSLLGLLGSRVQDLGLGFRV